jgi:polar amino acid transport system ATP-binding protein
MIAVRGLKKKFSNLEVLKGIDFDVKKSEVLCLIGPSGSGKSTLLRCLNRLEEANEGSIKINGEEICSSKVNINKLREKLGMVFQSFNLFPHLNVLANITFAPVELKLMNKEQAQKKAMPCYLSNLIISCI